MPAQHYTRSELEEARRSLAPEGLEKLFKNAMQKPGQQIEHISQDFKKAVIFLSPEQYTELSKTKIAVQGATNRPAQTTFLNNGKGVFVHASTEQPPPPANGDVGKREHRPIARRLFKR